MFICNVQFSRLLVFLNNFITSSWEKFKVLTIKLENLEIFYTFTLYSHAFLCICTYILNIVCVVFMCVCALCVYIYNWVKHKNIYVCVYMYVRNKNKGI